MTCPDNLLIAARRGALSAEEKVRLDAHVAGCAECRLALKVGGDFDAVLETRAGDELIAARFAKSVGTKLGRKKARGAWVVGAMVLMGVGMAAAAVRYGSLREEKKVDDHDDVRDHDHERVDDSVEGEGEGEGDVPASQKSDVKVEKPAPRASAAELFEQANARRRDGEKEKAKRLYRELQRAYPRSAEVQVSHVSLGRLCLELGEPKEALEQFERYLKKSARGPLAEEALFGKASALERLGRAVAERATWQALLEAYPESVYAERARARLERIP